MTTKFPVLFESLSAEFEAGEIKTRPGARGTTLRYITARAVQNRLDAVLGPENWWDRYRVARDNSTICSLTIRLPDGQEITKEGIGVTTPAVGEDAEKGAESDALKRAAVKFGIGRYLYHDTGPTPATPRVERSDDDELSRRVGCDSPSDVGEDARKLPDGSPYRTLIRMHANRLGIGPKQMARHLAKALAATGYRFEGEDSASRVLECGRLHDGGHPEWVAWFEDAASKYQPEDALAGSGGAGK